MEFKVAMEHVKGGKEYWCVYVKMRGKWLFLKAFDLEYCAENYVTDLKRALAKGHYERLRL